MELGGVTSGSQEPVNVVATLTDYNRNVVRDESLLGSLSRLYNEVRLVPMAPMDVQYINELQLPANVVVRGMGLASLDNELSNPVDYVGTRLHGGIRALQKGLRAVVVAIDNRAREISSDTGLPVLFPDNVTPSAVRAAFESYPWQPRLKANAIRQWREELAQVVR